VRFLRRTSFLLLLILLSLQLNVFAASRPIVRYTYKRSTVNDKNYTKLINDITKFISTKKGTYGITFYSLTNAQSFSINGSLDYVAASTKKVPINLYLYQLITEKKINPNEKMTYTKADYEGGTGIIQYKKYGTKYTIRELSRLSIVYSDNCATNMLSRKLGRTNILNYMEKLVKHKVNRTKNISSPDDMQIYMSEVLKFQKSYPVLGNQFLYDLEHTVFNDRIPRYLPKNVKIAHKIGNQVRALSDVGIVFAGKPYIVCIMTKDINEGETYKNIGTISKMIYDFEQKK
jgi:beta-lactamase class A